MAPEEKIEEFFANPRNLKKSDLDRGLCEAPLSAGASGPLRAGVLPRGMGGSGKGGVPWSGDSEKSRANRKFIRFVLAA